MISAKADEELLFITRPAQSGTAIKSFTGLQDIPHLRDLRRWLGYTLAASEDISP